MRVTRWIKDEKMGKYKEAHRFSRTAYYRLIRALVAEMRKKGLCFDGYYHQYGRGIPVFDDEFCLMTTMREWGRIMARVKKLRGKYAYCDWAWATPPVQKPVVPRKEKV